MNLQKPKNIIIFFLVGIILLFFSVWAFTRPAFLHCFNIAEKSGEIGDIIGGITAPITSLLGALLIYLSFTEQIKANKLIQSQWSYDTFVRLFNDIQNEYSTLKFTNVESYQLSNYVSVTYSGSEALINFISKMEFAISHNFTGILSDISFILEDLRALIEDIDKSDINIEKKYFIVNRINRFYISKLETQLISLKMGLEKNQNANLYNYHISSIVLTNQAIDKIRKKYLSNSII